MEITFNNLCNSCTSIGCEFQSGIVRTKCAFYMPPHIEPDNCGNYVLTQSLPNGGWIPMTKRPMTEEEREHYREWSDVEGAMIFDCELPEDGQEVLVSYGGYVCVDTFCTDDGCYFDGVDIDDVKAWMPLPQPYQKED